MDGNRLPDWRQPLVDLKAQLPKADATGFDSLFASFVTEHR